MSTKGRLQRTFPGPTLAFDTRVINETDLLRMFAQTISRMSQQPVAGTKPKVQKSKRKHDEDRDTTDPKMVIDFLMATLRPLSTDSAPIDIPFPAQDPGKEDPESPASQESPNVILEGIRKDSLFAIIMILTLL